MPTLSRKDQEQFEKARDLIETAPPRELGFAKSLFFGRLKSDAILPYPKQEPDEVRRMSEVIAKLDLFLKDNVDPDQIDREERISQHVIDGLGKLGILGLTVPTEYGGGGFSHTAYCKILERIAAHCTSTAVLVGAHQSIGLKALLLMGNEEQKRQFLPALARGEMLAAFCLSEPEVGSDAANVQTTARLSDDGRFWILNGQKKFATNAALAGFMTVMARTPVTENGKTKDKITAFIVTPDLSGFEIVSPNRSKCGIRGSWQATLKFTDMMVPADRVLGQLGKGLKVALSVLEFGRCTLSAGCVGGARVALDMAIDKARNRTQFGRKIGEFHLVKQKIARMAETVFAMDAMTYLCAGLVDRKSDDTILETAICKLFCSEGSWQVIDDALQIWGGEGYMRSNGLERMLRDARINRIVEGATEVMTAFVALMGMKGVGEELEAVMKKAKHPIGNFGRLSSFAGRQFKDIVLGNELDGLHPNLREEGRALARLTKQFARAVIRQLATHRERVLDMELVHERLAWAAIELYAMAAVTSKLQMMLESSDPNGHAHNGNGHAHHGNGSGNGSRADHDDALARDLTIGRSFCRHAAARISGRLRDLSDNLDPQVLRTADVILQLDRQSS